MARGHVRGVAVVLALQVDAYMGGSHKLLQGGAVVEVVVAWPQVRFGGKHAECDVAIRVRDITGGKRHRVMKIFALFIQKYHKKMQP